MTESAQDGEFFSSFFACTDGGGYVFVASFCFLDMCFISQSSSHSCARVASKLANQRTNNINKCRIHVFSESQMSHEPPSRAGGVCVGEERDST